MMLEILLLVNALWFAMGFNVFAIRNEIFAKLIVPREQRDTPVFEILAESGRFLGGFNFVFAVAHGSQFIFNVPIAIQNSKGGGVWQVKGTMLFIFVTDFIMMSMNLVAAAIYAF